MKEEQLYIDKLETGEVVASEIDPDEMQIWVDAVTTDTDDPNTPAFTVRTVLIGSSSAATLIRHLYSLFFDCRPVMGSFSCCRQYFVYIQAECIHHPWDIGPSSRLSNGSFPSCCSSEKNSFWCRSESWTLFGQGACINLYFCTVCRYLPLRY
jgi:hypothetical protein